MNVPQKRSFFQQPSGVSRAAMGETAGIGETPPSLVPVKYFGVQVFN
jgi:hypothetical protein